mmetsp:Transcript_81561/g.189447  ORF Transcript_81561/g.189447 Transcript_81561/m.189447 type:complete len:308 (-) Transcript_81561:315-1238(-)
MYTCLVGGRILGSISSRASPSFSLAGAMREVWKAPCVFSILACKAPAFSAKSLSAAIDGSVPAQEKPLGNSSLAISQTARPPSCFAASLQRASNLGFSRPAMESMACLPTMAASSMYLPRKLTSVRPSSKLKTPATQSAVYSPRERPARTWQRLTASSLSPRSFSTPASPAMNMAGWQILVSSSTSSGPLRHILSTSKPKISWALLSISLTAGRSFTPDNIFTYWEPCPGNRSPMGSGFSFGTAESATVMSSSSLSTTSASSPPYLAASRPCFVAAPGLMRYQPLGGGLPHSKRLYTLALFFAPAGM